MFSTAKEGRTGPGIRNTQSFVTALRSGNIPEIIQHAEDRHINIDGDDEAGQPPIYYALIAKERYIVMTLLHNDANPNIRLMDGSSPLHLCARGVCPRGDSKTRILLKEGADINSRDASGRTPLHIALINDNTTIANILLDHHDINVNVRDNQGTRPLHIASSLNLRHLGRRLVTRGAQVEPFFVADRIFSPRPCGR